VFKIKKEGWGGGGDRKLHFSKESTCKDTQLKVGAKICEIHVAPGLPNNTRPSITYYQKYNFESEAWWPKFDRLRQKFNIQIVKGDRQHASRSAHRAVESNKPFNSIQTRPEIVLNEKKIEKLV
jgi:hypothetical protein